MDGLDIHRLFNYDLEVNGKVTLGRQIYKISTILYFYSFVIYLI
jgi:hypothetical protein